MSTDETVSTDETYGHHVIIFQPVYKFLFKLMNIFKGYPNANNMLHYWVSVTGTSIIKCMSTDKTLFSASQYVHCRWPVSIIIMDID